MPGGHGGPSRIARPWLALLSALLLAGCLDPPAGGAGAAGDSPEAPPHSVRLSSAGIGVIGPPGYCLDQSASHLSQSGAFAAFRRCEVLRGQNVAMNSRAVLGVSVSDTANPQPVVAGSEAQLIAYFKTEPGRKVLSRSGHASTVTVLQDLARDKVVWLQVRDSSPTLALDATYWRAIFDLRGRLVTVTVTGFAEAPLAAARAKMLAESFVSRIRKANPAGKPAAGPATRLDGGAAKPNFNGFLQASPRL